MMSNQNYDQVTDLVAQGSLHWDTDQIVALLVTGAAFDGAHLRLSDVGASYVTSAPIQGRWIGEGGMAMGLPAAFQKVLSEQEYQVLVAQDDGRGNPVLLSFMNEDTDGNVIAVQRTGTLIVRPSQENLPTPPETVTPPPTTGFWLKL